MKRKKENAWKERRLKERARLAKIWAEGRIKEEKTGSILTAPPKNQGRARVERAPLTISRGEGSRHALREYLMH